MDYKKQIASCFIAFRFAKKQTQTKVAKKLGVTFQQVQKYESMQNGISAVKLLKFCKAYEIPLDHFETRDAWSIIDGADISYSAKAKAQIKLEKLDEEKNDKSGSEKDMAGQGFSQGTHI